MPSLSKGTETGSDIYGKSGVWLMGFIGHGESRGMAT